MRLLCGTRRDGFIRLETVTDMDKSIQIMKENIVMLNSAVAAYEKVASYVIMKSEFEKTPPKRSIRRFLYQDLAR